MAAEPLTILREHPPVNIPDDLDSERLKALYRWMCLYRAYDEKGYTLARSGKIAIYYSATGEEASVIGSAFALEPQDWVFPSYREAGAFLVRGVPMVTMFGQLFGNAADICLGHQSPIHYSYSKCHMVSISSPIGTQIIQAAGAGMAIKIKKENPRPVVMTYFGDGATSSNDFHSGMNFAGVSHAPVVFVCQNNQWAISLPVHQQTAVVDLADKAKAYGFTGQVVDGNDVLAVYEATRQALHRARNGEGPQFLELKTYRVGAHSTPDDPRRYRSKEEEDRARQRDPIIRYRTFLEQQNLWDADQENRLWQEARTAVNEAAGTAEKAGSLAWETMFEAVYSQLTPLLKEEKEALRNELESVGTPEEQSPDLQPTSKHPPQPNA